MTDVSKLGLWSEKPILEARGCEKHDPEGEKEESGAHVFAKKKTLIDFGVGKSAFCFVSKRQVELQQQQQQFAK